MLLFLAILLFLILPEPWNVILGLISFAGGLVEVGYWQRRMRRRSPATGVDTLVGRTGTVTESCRPRGQVRVGGELWQARCDAGADPGAAVRVTAVDGLTLVVEPAAA